MCLCVCGVGMEGWGGVHAVFVCVCVWEGLCLCVWGGCAGVCVYGVWVCVL